MSPTLHTFALIIAAFCSFNVSASTLDNKSKTNTNDYTHNAILDEFGKFHLYWKLSDTAITFEIHVETLGYVGFGISPNGGMANADIVIGWVKDGEVFFTDRFATSNSEPSIDNSQDYELIGGMETDTHTILTFSRQFETCDPDDRVVTEGTLRLIYSYHPDDPVSETGLAYHGTGQRGSRSVHLRGVSPVLPEMPTGDDLLTFEFMNPNISVPHDKDTTYWCQAFKMPKLNSKHHMIKYEPVVQPGHEALVHHILIYQCHHKVDDDLHGYGHECYSPNMAGNLTECTSVIISWAIGGEAFYLPEEAGFSLGDLENGDPDFVLMETHYDNPDFRDTFIDSSGIRIYYTPVLRDNDAAVMEIGNLVTLGHFIPPGATDFVTNGHCPKECLSKTLADSEITVFASVLHSHLAGVELKTRHFRDGVELPIIAVDDTYDFNYQEMRYLKEPATIRSGDELVTQCMYNTKGRSGVTYGGLGTKEEMCLHFMYYYPRKTLSNCGSLPFMEVIVASLTGANILDVRLNYETFIPTIISPEEYAGQRLDEYLASLAWTETQMDAVMASYHAGFTYYCEFGGTDGKTELFNLTLLQEPLPPLPEPESICVSESAATTLKLGIAVILTILVSALYLL
ncbi:DBH-like monooxygenase protein 1 homolog [Glandiceps talaboti]